MLSICLVDDQVTKVLFFYRIKDHIAGSLEPRLFQHPLQAPVFPPNGLAPKLDNHSHN